MFFYGLLESVIVKFLQKDIDRFFKKIQTNESTKKIDLRGKKETME